MEKTTKSVFKSQFPEFYKSLKSRNGGHIKNYIILTSEVKDSKDSDRWVEPEVYAFRNDGTLFHFTRFGNSCLIDTVTDTRLITIALQKSKKVKIPRKTFKAVELKTNETPNEVPATTTPIMPQIKTLILTAMYHGLIPIVKCNRKTRKISVNIHSLATGENNWTSSTADALKNYIVESPKPNETAFALGRLIQSAIRYRNHRMSKWYNLYTHLHKQQQYSLIILKSQMAVDPTKLIANIIPGNKVFYKPAPQRA